MNDAIGVKYAINFSIRPTFDSWRTNSKKLRFRLSKPFLEDFANFLRAFQHKHVFHAF
jgi:hypothetical protein